MCIENQLNFVLENKSKKLLAIFVPDDNKAKVSAVILQQLLVKKNLSHLFIHETRLFQLAKLCNDAIESFQFEIGELKDASCDISISPDEMTATLTVTTHLGGQPITLTSIHDALQQAEIVYGILPDKEIKKILEPLDTEKSITFIIAKGLESVDGTDAKFESLIPEPPAYSLDNESDEEEQKIIDFRAFSSIVVIEEGQAVMRRIPATQGQDGYNIFGKLQKAYHGVDLPFAIKEGVCLDSDDNDLLRSTIVGTATLIPCGVSVHPVLVVKSVNFETGNINFAGTVIVQGDVENGMSVSAMDDLAIEGNVENARLECGGALTIHGNTQNSNLRADGDVYLQGGINTSKVISHGSVNVLFSEYSNIEAGLNIAAYDYSLNSGLFAGNKIVIGQKGAKRKSLVGGIAWAMLEIKASILGINTEMRTDIRVGSDPYIERKINELDDLIAGNDMNQVHIKRLIDHLNANVAHSSDRASLTERLNLNLHKLIVERESYDKELQTLNENMATMEYARVSAERQVNVGCIIQISGITYKTNEKLGQSVFRNKFGKITVTNKLSSLIRR